MVTHQHNAYAQHALANMCLSVDHAYYKCPLFPVDRYADVQIDGDRKMPNVYSNLPPTLCSEGHGRRSGFSQATTNIDRNALPD